MPTSSATTMWVWQRCTRIRLRAFTSTARRKIMTLSTLTAAYTAAGGGMTGDDLAVWPHGMGVSFGGDHGEGTDHGYGGRGHAPLLFRPAGVAPGAGGGGMAPEPRSVGDWKQEYRDPAGGRSQAQQAGDIVRGISPGRPCSIGGGPNEQKYHDGTGRHRLQPVRHRSARPMAGHGAHPAFFIGRRRRSTSLLPGSGEIPPAFLSGSPSGADGGAGHSWRPQRTRPACLPSCPGTLLPRGYFPRGPSPGSSGQAVPEARRVKTVTERRYGTAMDHWEVETG